MKNFNAICDIDVEVEKINESKNAVIKKNIINKLENNYKSEVTFNSIV